MKKTYRSPTARKPLHPKRKHTLMNVIN